MSKNQPNNQEIKKASKSWLILIIQTVIAVAFSMTAASTATHSETRALQLTDANSAAQTGRLVLSPINVTATVNGKGTMVINADTGGANVNSIEALVNFDANLIRVDSVSFENSICTIIVEQVLNQAQGTLKISCGVPYPGISTQLGNVANLYYTAIALGTASFTFSPSATSILANDGIGTNILRSTENASVVVQTAGSSTVTPAAIFTTAVATPAPTSSTATHSASQGASASTASNAASAASTTSSAASSASENPTVAVVDIVPVNPALKKVPLIMLVKNGESCLSDSTADFAWLKQADIDSFEYELNNLPGIMTSPVSTTGTRVNLTVDTNSQGYFHVLSIKGDAKSQISTVRLVACPVSADSQTDSLGNSLKRSLSDSSFNVFKNIGRWVANLL